MRTQANTSAGFVTNAMNSMQPTSTRTSCPYSVKISGPFWDTDVYTSPRMPKGARPMTQRTTVPTASAMLENTSFVVALAARRAMPSTTAQARMPM